MMKYAFSGLHLQLQSKGPWLLRKKWNPLSWELLAVVLAEDEMLLIAGQFFSISTVEQES